MNQLLHLAKTSISIHKKISFIAKYFITVLVFPFTLVSKKVCFTICLLLLVGIGYTQTAITSYTTVIATPFVSTNSANGWLTTDGCGNTVYFDNAINYTSFFGQRYVGTGSAVSTSVTGFVASGLTFKPISASSSAPYTNVNLQRINNPVVSGNRFTGFFKYSSFKNPSTGATVSNVWSNDADIYIEPGYVNTMEGLLNQFSLDYGTDNTFVNTADAGPCTGAATSNNIERVDLVYSPGIGGTTAASLSKLGFLINERGGNDNFKAAAITSTDGSGNVTGLGNLISVTTSKWGQVGPSVAAAIYMGTNGGTIQPKEYKTAQTISGVFISFSDLGIAANTKIYGIAILPDDIIGNPLTLASTPLNTNDNTNTTVGLDLMSGNFFSREQNNFDVLAQTLSGNIWDDTNGDGISANENNVSGTDVSSAGSIATGGNLFVNIVNAATGNVVAVVQVAADGTYTYNGMLPNFGYKLILTTSAGTIGSPVSASVPPGWVNTKENLNGIISSANPGVIAFTSPDLTNITNYNFGIEKVPNSDNKTYTIGTPAVNSVITLNGTGMIPGPLSGSDFEDGILGAGSTLIITKVPTDAELSYDGVLVANNTTINNYNPDELQIKFTSTSSLNTSFQYTFIDSASQQSITPATYMIAWTTPLPIVLSSFNATAKNNTSLLQWVISSEINTSKFIIERSTDNGESWQAIGSLNAKGNSSVSENYSYTDENPSTGENIYRLRIVDNDGTYTYSGEKEISFSGNPTITIFPNPITTGRTVTVALSGFQAGNYMLSVLSSSGQSVTVANLINVGNEGTASYSLSMQHLSKGNYIILIEGNGQRYTSSVTLAGE